MQTSGRPLIATRIDQALYLERNVDERVRAALKHSLNVLIVGTPGSGKTSMLHHLEYGEREAGETSCYVDGRRAGSADELLDAVRRGLSLERPTGGGLQENIARATGEPLPAPAAERSLAQLTRSLKDQAAVVLIDSPDHAAAHALFGQLRDVVWQVPASWIVATGPSVESELRRPPADAFFDVVLRLDELDPSEQQRLLGLRGVPPMIASSTISTTQGAPKSEWTPRAVLALARRLALDEGDGDELLERQRMFQSQLDELSRAAAMLAMEIRETGAVSASDEALQRRMGWTRARLTQVFKELEAAGVVRATEAPGGRTGRPKRFYEVIEP